MRPTPKLILSTIFLGLAICSLIFYLYIQSKDYLSGPRIKVSYPIEGNLVYGPELEIRGNIKRATYATMNDSQILVDSEGNFREKLMLTNGYNIIEFGAIDRFGKKTQKLLEFMVTSTPQK